jgi:hypothetical protein
VPAPSRPPPPGRGIAALSRPEIVADTGAANSSGATLRLSSGCTYSITTPATVADGLPIVTGQIVIQATGNTVISRSTAASTAFRVLEVSAAGSLSLSGVTVATAARVASAAPF